MTATWVDLSDKASNFKSFTDAKLAGKWLVDHVLISRYCLQIAKCKNDERCKSLRTNVQEVLGGKFLSTPLVLANGPSLTQSKRQK